MRASDLDYDLDPELIAQAPLPERDGARLLWMQRERESVEHRQIRELPGLLARALFVVNDTKVIPARLFAHKASGGRAEILLVEKLVEGHGEQRWFTLGKASKGLRVGTVLQVPDSPLTITIEDARGEGGLEVTLRAASGVAAEIARHGHMPLPPYIRRADDVHDTTRYQTVFAAHEGAVAAPPAGLHLSEALLAQLHAHGHALAQLTLHVGPGTFAPLRSEELADHPMHQERYIVPPATADAIARAKGEGRPVVAVGTTVVRTLEAAADEHGAVRAGAGRTSIFIYPPFRFRVVDALLTNFHLPRSTLLALVMAFGGTTAVRHAYAQAVAARYRFFSYGDAMLITGAP